MIDLHSHLIPGVDDGSRTVEQSVGVLQMMAEHGITDVCLTPHLTTARADRGIPRSHDEAFDSLAALAPKDIRLHRGVELMLDRPLSETAGQNRRLTLGGSRYILVEFTRMVAPNAAFNALSQVVTIGLVPVLAHPERYACCTPGVAAQWKSTGAVMQVDATTVIAPRTRGERARALLESGMADILAADNHGDRRMVTTPYVFLCEQAGQEQADLLLSRNPSAILGDRTLEPVPPLAIRKSLLARLRQLLDPEE